MCKVSVIVNCYNGEKYLKEALECIKNQTFTDYEVVFIDNCSTDNSANIAKSFGDKLKYYKTDKTIPLGAGRNCALERCNGEYIAFLDCDDLWEKDKLLIQTKLMDSNSNCVLTMSNIYMLNMIDGRKTITIDEKKQKKLNLSDFAIDYEYGMSSFMLRKSVIEENNIRFDERLSYAEEYDFFLRLSCFGDVIYSPEVLATYRVHESMNSKKLKETIPFEYEIVRKNLLECDPGVTNKYPNVVDYLVFLRDYTQAKIYIENGKLKDARKILESLKDKYKKAKVYYYLTYLPEGFVKKIYSMYYKHKVV